MLNTKGLYRLVFSTTADVSLDLIQQSLEKIGFASQAIFSNTGDKADFDREFCVGTEFLSSLTFMGCSPYIEFEPPADLQYNDVADFCFIRLSSNQQADVAYHAGQFEILKTAPRCKLCRKVISNWGDKAEALNHTWKLNCPHCETELLPATLDWRKASGSGSIFIEVMNIYLQEAVPTDGFMQQLESITASKWTYFYTDANIKANALDRA